MCQHVRDVSEFRLGFMVYVNKGPHRYRVYVCVCVCVPGPDPDLTEGLCGGGFTDLKSDNIN